MAAAVVELVLVRLQRKVLAAQVVAVQRIAALETIQRDRAAPRILVEAAAD